LKKKWRKKEEDTKASQSVSSLTTGLATLAKPGLRTVLRNAKCFCLQSLIDVISPHWFIGVCELLNKYYMSFTLH